MEEINPQIKQDNGSCLGLCRLTQLDNRVHGTDSSQNARQLVLPDVRQPLGDGVLYHFVHSEETRRGFRRQSKELATGKLVCNSNMMIK